MKIISITDDPVLISRKIRAFWRPPFEGATLAINGQRFTVVNDYILNELGDFYK